MSNGSVSNLPDGELVRQAQAGDPQAFDALVRRHQQLVFAVAFRMLGDRSDAEDVAQDAFVRAYDGLAGFRGDAKLSTWLVSITMNLARNRRRWWARRRQVIAASLDEPADPDTGAGHDAADPAPGPAVTAEQRERHRFLMAALQQLRPGDRSVIVLRDINGESYEDIAATLKCRLGTVKSRLSRARLQLRAMLDGRLR